MKTPALDFFSVEWVKSIKIVTRTSWWSTKVSELGKFCIHDSHCDGQQNNNNSWFQFIDTPIGELEDCFKRFIKRDDIDIILINQNFAELIRHVIDAHTSPLPAVLEIPSKDHPYDASKDSILRRAKVCWIKINYSFFSRPSFNGILFFSFFLLQIHRECSTQKIWSANCILYAALYSSSVC